MMLRHLALALAATMMVPAAALAEVAITSKIFVLAKEQNAKGETVTKRLEPTKVIPGDRLEIELAYENDGEPATDVVIVNPMPDSTTYAGVASKGAEFSVDGGKTFAALAALKVTENGTTRAAIAADVTHVRWVLATLAPAAKGNVSFEVTVD